MMKMTSKDKNPSEEGGMTLAEVLVALFLTMALFAAMASAYAVIRGSISAANHRMEALNVARGQIERLRGMAFDNIVPMVQNNITLSSGPDGVIGTADDFTGTLTVLVQDTLDFDGDNIFNEPWLDIDNNGVNDQTAKPIQVTCSWVEPYLGQNRNLNVQLNTVISR